MADKTAAELIAEHEAELAKLKKKQDEELVKAAPKYPKHIRVEAGPADVNALTDVEGKRYIMVEVQSEEEEKARSKGDKSKGAPVVVEPEDRKAVAKAEAEEKAAAEAKAAEAKRGGRR